eukprot:scaffold6026_cov163-Amphora_coffeaeformis.AAC.9
MSKKPVGLDDCERPSCADVQSMFSKAMKAASTSDNSGTSTPRVGKSTGVECPPSGVQIGRGSWTLLHSMAAWYPDDPSEDDKTKMKNFFEALAQFYPCTYCADDFRKKIRTHPIRFKISLYLSRLLLKRTESRTELCKWVCEQHNMVNEKLGKKAYSCDIETLDERWRKSSDASC